MNVLLADDNVGVLSAFRSWLGAQDNITIVGEVTNADVLLDVVETTQPDVLLLDWELRGLQTNDIRDEMMQTARANNPHLRIVMLSSRSEVEEQALACGADAFVSKAEPPDYLHHVIATWEEDISK